MSRRLFQPEILVLGLSLILSTLLINPNYFPYSGIAISGMLVIFFAYYFKKDKNTYDAILAFLAATASGLYAFRTNDLTLFFLFCVYVYTYAWLITPNKSPIKSTWGYFLLAPILICFIPFVKKSGLETSFIEKLSLPGQYINNPQINWIKLTVNLLITILVLAVIIPILITVNPIFGQYINNIVNFFNLEYIFENFFNETIIARIVIFVVSFLYFERLISLVGSETDGIFRENKGAKINWILLIPKIAIALTLGLFIVSQAQLYTASKEYLANLGYSLGRYSNEIFLQLSVVSIIVLSLVYFDIKKTKNSLIATVVLLVQTLILGVIALRSDWVYIATWGLTEKRLYGLFVVLFLFGLVSLFGHAAYKNKDYLLKNVTVWLGFVLLLTGLINFDYLIFHSDPPRDSSGTAKQYLYNLSFDSHSLKQQYEELSSFVVQKLFQEKLYVYCEEYADLINKIDDINYLKEKYEKPVFSEFNLSEYLNYLDVKDLNVDREATSKSIDDALEKIKVQKSYTSRQYTSCTNPEFKFDEADFIDTFELKNKEDQLKKKQEENTPKSSYDIAIESRLDDILYVGTIGDKRVAASFINNIMYNYGPTASFVGNYEYEGNDIYRHLGGLKTGDISN